MCAKQEIASSSSSQGGPSVGFLPFWEEKLSDRPPNLFSLRGMLLKHADAWMRNPSTLGSMVILHWCHRY